MCMKNLHIQIQAIGTIQEAEMINITQGITHNLQALRLHIYMYTIEV